MFVLAVAASNLARDMIDVSHAPFILYKFCIQCPFCSSKQTPQSKKNEWLNPSYLLTTIDNTLCQHCRCHLPSIGLTPSMSTAGMSTTIVHMMQPLIIATTAATTHCCCYWLCNSKIPGFLKMQCIIN